MLKKAVNSCSLFLSVVFFLIIFGPSMLFAKKKANSPYLRRS